MILPRTLAAAILMPILTTVAAVAADRLEYPPTRRVDHTDTFHGAVVADPYRWLEADVRHTPEVAGWVAAENKLTFGYLAAIPQRETIRRRLTELWNFPQYSAPFKEGGRYFYSKNDGLQNQAVLYTADAPEAAGRVLLDPNRWSKDGTVALSGLTPSRDGKYLAYGVAEAGSDWCTWRALEIESGTLLADELKWTKFTEASWTNDGRGFFYSRYPEPAAGTEFQTRVLNNKLCYHRIGQPQASDVVVYSRPDQPQWQFHGEVSEDGRWLVITTSLGTDAKYRITVKDLTEPNAVPQEVIDTFDNEYSFIGNDGPTLYFVTDRAAPRRRLIAVDLRKPQPGAWREIIPQAADTLMHVGFVGNLFAAQYLHDVRPQVKLFSTAGRLVREVEFPAIGTVRGFAGKRVETETFYTFVSFATPPTIYRYDLISGKSQLLRRPEVKFRPEDYEVEQVFYRSKDGTRVPMFLAHKKGLVRDGANPTLLYGYGGFDIPLLPDFGVSRLVWMEMGGVFASANLRGGGEYGKPWHEAGTKLQKQNVFDDFIAAAEWLIAEKYTQPKKLAIQGGSNGGLLVGAVMTQRPELFGACLPAVGVMDMLRFQRFTEGPLWADDYGNADTSAAEFKALLAYSPYHNLRPAKYPATLITTADTDDRVVPGHSFKFAAALQKAQQGDAPVLIRIETRAGHGAGKPVTKRIAETADLWAFLVKALGMKVPAVAD